MLVTEQEAREKWCPFARCGSATAPGWSHNRECATAESEPSPGAMCIGSACMAWRAGVYEHQRNLAPQDRTPNVGYCGLAGSVS